MSVRRLDDTNEFVLMDDVTREYEQAGELLTLFKDGKFSNISTFDEIRNRIKGK